MNFVVLLGALAIAACDRRDPTGHVGHTTTTGGTPDDHYGYSRNHSRNSGQQNTPSMLSVGDPNDGAMNDIAHALCAHELAGGRVGPPRRWNDDAACLRAMRLGIFGDLQQSECHAAVPDKVRACVDAIHGAQCDAGDMMQSAGCRKEALCSR